MMPMTTSSSIKVKPVFFMAHDPREKTQGHSTARRTGCKALFLGRKTARSAAKINDFRFSLATTRYGVIFAAGAKPTTSSGGQWRVKNKESLEAVHGTQGYNEKSSG
jgi:hypothetical protein